MEFPRQGLPRSIGVVAQYPGVGAICLVVDNWPVHFHPDVTEALQERQCPFPFQLPASWKELRPSGKHRGEGLPMQPVPLPTCPPWLSPSEKTWRWPKRGLLHNRSFANDFKGLKVKVEEFPQPLNSPSIQTLSLVGLLRPDGIYADQLRSAGVVFTKRNC